MVPLWLDEGLAEYFEVPAEKREYGNGYTRQVKWSARLGFVASLDRLEGIGDMKLLGPREYRQAWAWVHFLLHGPADAQAELKAYLNDIERHTPPGHLSKRLAEKLSDADAAFAAHFRSWSR
jgi:hypothetical protein